VYSWWHAVKRERVPPRWREHGTRVRRGLFAADRVIAPTRSMLNDLETHYGKLPRTEGRTNDGSARARRDWNASELEAATGRTLVNPYA
jgi:hypothetical protein